MHSRSHGAGFEATRRCRNKPAPWRVERSYGLGMVRRGRSSFQACKALPASRTVSPSPKLRACVESTNRPCGGCLGGLSRIDAAATKPGSSGEYLSRRAESHRRRGHKRGSFVEHLSRRSGSRRRGHDVDCPSAGPRTIHLVAAATTRPFGFRAAPTRSASSTPSRRARRARGTFQSATTMSGVPSVLATCRFSSGGSSKKPSRADVASALEGAGPIGAGVAYGRLRARAASSDRPGSRARRARSRVAAVAARRRRGRTLRREAVCARVDACGLLVGLFCVRLGCGLWVRAAD